MGKLFLAFITFAVLLPLIANAQTKASIGGSPCLLAPALPAPSGNVVNVSSEAGLQSAMTNLVDNTSIVLAPGTYNLSRSLFIRKNNITIRGETDKCDDVVLVGQGMENANYGNVPHGIWSDAANLFVANLSITDVYFHPIQFDSNAVSPHIYNLKLLNAGEQFIKGASSGFEVGVSGGIVEYTIMEYTNGPPVTDHGGGTGYTNGVDILGGSNWIVRNNVFKNFHTPDSVQNIWNPAILMWNGTRNTIAEGNTFINVDRAIAFGLTDKSGSDHFGGIIRNNFIYIEPGLFSASRKSGSDGAIIVWDSPQTKVYHNTVITNGNTNKSIEYRFQTTGGDVRNNLVDAPFGTRNGAQFSESGNVFNADLSMFAAPGSGNLHLSGQGNAQLAIDKVSSITDVPKDIDGQARPIGANADVGADEFSPGGGDTISPAPPRNLRIRDSGQSNR